MRGERSLRWHVPARARLAGALLAALLATLGLLAVRAVPQLTAAGGGHPPATMPLPPLVTSGVLPQAAVGPVSAVLGAVEPSYHVHPGPAGARALNRGQGFAAAFTRDGVTVSSQSLSLALRATAAGFGGASSALAPVAPHTSSNRVTYDHPGLQEWYANGPFGLEQGFTVDRSAAAAAGQRSGDLTIKLALSGSTRPLLAQHGGSVTLRSPSGATLRYSGLRALDASGRVLPSWLSLNGQSLSLHVRAAGAHFPISVDPVLTGEGLIIELGQGQGEASEKEAFGTSVSLSADGTTALVGGPEGSSHTGAAWVFHREGAVWSLQSKLSAASPGEEGACEEPGEKEVGEQPVSCAFGTSVALSGTGDTALIGAPRAGLQPGVAWVFNRTGSEWVREEQPLVGPKEEGQQRFGFSVSLSTDGSHALVGAPTEHGGRGEAYVFERVEGTWGAAVPLIAKEEGPGGHLGFSTALSADGQQAIVGAPLDALKKGTAFIFEHVGLNWVQNGNLLTGLGENGEGRFGESVAMAGNGGTVLVGAPDENGKRGAVWTYVEVGGKWREFGPKLLGPEKLEKEEFGRGLALSGNGTQALIGAPRTRAKKAGEGAGVAYLYEANKSEWEPLQSLEASLVETGHGQFAKAVSMTEKAETLLIGAPHETNKAGAVWLYGQRPTVEEVKTSPTQEGNAKARGHLKGENKVWIVGRYLKNAKAVWFGGPPHKAEILERLGAPQEGGQEELVVKVPPGEEGVDECKLEHEAVSCVNVQVETDEWLSAENTNAVYLYFVGADEEREKEGGSGGGGPKNKKSKNTEIPISQLNNPSGSGTGTTNNNTGKGIGVVSGVTSAASPSCKVYLRSSKISVATHARAMISLAARGSGRCGGHLTLQVSVKKGKHNVAKAIASGSYAANAGQNLRVALKLGSSGQALLRAGHGHLKARLLIGRSYPTALKASASNVTLSTAKK